MSQYILVFLEHDTRSKIKHTFVLCPIKTIYCEGNILQRMMDELYLEFSRIVKDYQSESSQVFIPQSALRLFETHLSILGNKVIHELVLGNEVGYLEEDPYTSFPPDYKTYREGHNLSVTNDDLNFYRSSGVFACPDKCTIH